MTQIKTQSHMGLSGEFRAVLRDTDDSIISDSGWDSNLILDNGLSIYATENWFGYCAIGSNGGAPSVGEVNMSAWIASQPAVLSTDPDTNPVAPNYEVSQVKTWRFTGIGPVTVRQMGLGAADLGQNMYCLHTLAIPIALDTNQSLDVSYRTTMWPSIIVGSTSSNLIGGVNYTVETSMYDLARHVSGTVYGTMGITNPGAFPTTVYDGAAAGPTDTSPSGDNGVGGNRSITNYAQGSFTFTMFYGLTQAVTNGLVVKTAVYSTQTTGWNLQTEFSAEDGPNIGGGIPKDGTLELTLVHQMTWGRRP